MNRKSQTYGTLRATGPKPTPARQCTAETADGRRCTSPAAYGSPLCNLHRARASSQASTGTTAAAPRDAAGPTL